MYDKNKMATRIKELRKKADMSQEQLGKKLDMNKSTIQRYENAGVNKIKEPVIEKMAEVLKTSSEYLLGVTDEPTLKSSNVISLEEKIHLDKYNQLNHIGKNKADEYIDDLYENPKYRKETDPSVQDEDGRKYTNLTFEDDKERKAAFGGIGEDENISSTT